MLYSVAGSRLFIADQPVGSWVEPAAPASVAWLEIDGVEAFGLLGAEWDILPTGDMNTGFEGATKGIQRRPEIPMILGNNPGDPGQALIWAASRSTESYPFRILFPDGVAARSWYALVIRIGEVFDSANSVIRLQADLKPTSAIFRSEAP